MSDKFLCIYHANCADGFTAAWVVRQALGDAVEFHPGKYGETPPDVNGRDVILVDFSYKRAVLEDMAQSAHSVLILDHHKSARDDLEGLEPAPEHWLAWYAALDAFPRPHIAALFDMERSGAGIAWDFFSRNYPRAPLVDYVEDRDLWRFAMPDSRAIATWIFSHEYDFTTWDRIADRLREDGSRTRAALSGYALIQKHDKDVAELIAETRRTMKIGGHIVSVANLPYTMSSDAGHIMAQGDVFAACYMDTPRGRVFSLRSSDDGLDVSVIAAAYGGGGHARAAGFTAPIGWEGDE